MTKKSLALCLPLLAGVALVPAAYAEVKVSGSINFGIDGINQKTTTTFADGSQTKTHAKPRANLFDDTSYIRFRGNEKLNDNLDFLYQAELRARYEEGERYDRNSAGQITRIRPRQLEMRDTYLGVRHKEYGTLKFGRMDTLDEKVTSFTKVPTAIDGIRTDNMIEYESPKFADTRVYLQYGLDENNNTDYFDTDVAGIAIKKSGKKYELGGAYVYANNTSRPRNNNRTLHKDIARIAGRYDIDKTHTVGFMLQQNRYNHQTKSGTWVVDSFGQDPRTERGYSLTYEYNTGKKIIYDIDLTHTQNAAGKDRDVNGVRLSYLRQFNKNLMGIFEIDHRHTKENIPAYNGAMARQVDTKTTAVALIGSYRF